MGRKLSIAGSLLFAGVLVATTLEGANALALRAAVATDQRAGTKIQHDGTEYGWADFMIHQVAPQQLGVFRAWLVRSSSSTLRAAQYVMAGLGGGVFAYWLWLLGLRLGHDERMGQPWLRILAGGVAGLLVLLLIRLPAPLLAEWPVLGEGVQAVPNDVLLDSCHALAVLAGLFLASFLKSLRLIPSTW